MAEYLIKGETLTGIAEAIRGKTGGADPIAVTAMAAQIESITGGGSGGGGGSLPAGLYWLNDHDNLPAPTIYNQYWYTFNGELYANARNGSGGGNTGDIYKFANGAWTKVVSAYTFNSMFNGFRAVEFNGKVHFYGQETESHYIYDGASSPVRVADIPNRIVGNAAFVQGGKLKAYSYYDGIVYVWDEATDSWTAEATIGAKYQYWLFFTIENTVYAWYSKKVYRYDSGTLTELFSTTNNLSYASKAAVHNGCFYTVSGASQYGSPLLEIDVNNSTEKTVGRVPPIKNGAEGLLSFQNHLRLYNGDDSNKASMVAYEVEVTE